MALYRLLASIVAVAVAGVPAACSATSANPLLGRWQAEPNGFVDRNGFHWCEVVPEIDFGPASQTTYAAATKSTPAAKRTISVVYLVAGPKVYVSSTPGFAGAPMYTMVDANEMHANDMGSCKYKRM